MELELCWNAFGEVDNLKGGLGTAVPAQKNPDVLSLQGNVRFSRETIGYVPLRESKIVAPSEMFIVGDRPGFLWRSEELVKVALAVVRSTSTFCLVVMGRRRTSRSWMDMRNLSGRSISCCQQKRRSAAGIKPTSRSKTVQCQSISLLNPVFPDEEGWTP